MALLQECFSGCHNNDGDALVVIVAGCCVMVVSILPVMERCSCSIDHIAPGVLKELSV